MHCCGLRPAGRKAAQRPPQAKAGRGRLGRLPRGRTLPALVLVGGAHLPSRRFCRPLWTRTRRMHLGGSGGIARALAGGRRALPTVQSTGRWCQGGAQATLPCPGNGCGGSPLRLLTAPRRTRGRRRAERRVRERVRAGCARCGSPTRSRRAGVGLTARSRPSPRLQLQLQLQHRAAPGGGGRRAARCAVAGCRRSPAARSGRASSAGRAGLGAPRPCPGRMTPRQRTDC